MLAQQQLFKKEYFFVCVAILLGNHSILSSRHMGHTGFIKLGVSSVASFNLSV